MSKIDRVNRVTRRTAEKISAALDQMVAALPEDAAPQLAIEFVVSELAGLQPWLMSLVMEDENIREAYAAAVALQPATAKQ